MTWFVRAEPLFRFGLDGYRLFVIREDGIGHFSLVQPATLKEHPVGSFAPEEESFLSDTGLGDHQSVRQFLQAMADEAWKIGILPSHIEDHKNELIATKYHLEDMRALALAPHTIEDVKVSRD